ncbi:uncharacterized protein CLAFUR5_10918 [Fulvia fulva]|uniref:Uncharacterized protein n=1 Tax=Passalora fulva TaxID=5499 RepID=A0A9Q8PE44_PASFU|nr:uncharacterized protein CLAFUR5_10918 [Fulvia fulva]KAK4618430.1 hypothetical protein CLAFUR0_11894 [Fulvia fulva]UJO20788.1 hypothetical protein CLAFUR5_10918 [Fulvia fulva]
MTSKRDLCFRDTPDHGHGSHRPRGYRWNCLSDFQQTPAFRHIRYDECLAPEDDGLLTDDEDDFALPERAAKRRRVEQLADDFLNGVALEIHSARLVPEALRTAVAFSSFPRPKDFRYAIADIETQNDSDDIWEDVDDDQDIFRRLRGACKADEDDSGVFVDGTVSVEELEVTEVQAQASCGPKRRLRSTQVTAGPSEEALRVAAALRNRKLRQTITSLPVESQPQSCPPPVIPETQTQSSESSLDETASDCGPSPTPAWTSSKWLKTGAFQPKKHVDEDCSRDELGTSSIFTLSQKSRNRERPLARGKAGPSSAASGSFSTAPSATAASGISESFVLRVGSLQVPESSNVTHAQYDEHSVETSELTEFQTAPQDHGGAKSDDIIPDDDSQSRLLRRQGLRVAPRKSWVAMNDISEHTEEPTFVSPEERQPTCDETVGGVNAIDEETSMQDKQPKGRKTKSTGCATEAVLPRRSSSRRQSAPSESQSAAEAVQRPHRDKGQYIEVEVNGFSPLVLRKRGSKHNKERGKKAEPPQTRETLSESTPRRKVTFSSSSPGKVRPIPVPAPAPHTPLVDEHLNTILPQAAGSGRRSSSVRRALRDELEASGAELSRCGDEASSQPEPIRRPALHESQEDDDAVDQAPAVPETQWPGTQAMLAQAQDDMFTSPEKSNSDQYLGDKSSPQLHGPRPNPSRSARKPLKQLSQEPVALPSTQALLQDWQPWSSIKKPGVTREFEESLESPSLAKKPTPRTVSASYLAVAKTAAARSASGSIRSRGSASARRSSLRFSMSFSESPEKIDHQSEPNAAVAQEPKAASQPSFSPLDNDMEKHDDTVSDLDIHSPKKTTRGIFSSMRLTGTQKSPVTGNAASGLSKPPTRRSSSGLKSTLSFGISSLDLPVHRDAESQQDTILPPDSQDSQTLMQNAQQVLVDEDSQVLARTIMEVTTDVLGTADTFSF